MGNANSMEQQLRTALEAADSGELLRLCGRLDSNIELTVGGYRGFTKHQSVSHHLASKPVSLSCLKLLIDRLGPACLTCRNADGETPLHYVALHQDESWMELVKEKCGRGCLDDTANSGRKLAHYAAMNKKSNSILNWLVKEVGSDCLTDPDNNRVTPVHFAAQFQGVDSLELIRKHLGTDCFQLKGSRGETAFHIAAMKSDNANLNWLVKEVGSNCLTVPDKFGHTAVHWAARFQSVESFKLIYDQIGDKMFDLKNNNGETPADFVNKDQDEKCKQAKLSWITIYQRQTEALPLAPESSSTPTVVSVSDGKSLDPNFNSWKFLLHEGNRQLIGSGGFGQVYKALTDRYQTVAVKIVPVTGGNQPGELGKAIEMEQRGIDILKRINHRNIIQFLKCELKSDGLYIFTELVSGHSLRDLMKEQHRPFTEYGVRDFTRQICAGLNYLHSQPDGPILHRDIKCSNIMLNNERVIKLIDFGLAKVVTTSCGQNTSKGGTFHFLAPELFKIDEKIPYSTKSDVWALGCTVFEMTAMQPPDGDLSDHQIPIRRFQKHAMPPISEQFSDNLQQFYSRCVEFEPEVRADITELLDHAFLKDAL